MNIVASTSLTILIALSPAVDAGYGTVSQQAAAPVDYATYPSSGPEPPSAYGYSPYPANHGPYAKAHYPDYVEPAYPQKVQPNPFIKFPTTAEPAHDLRIPNLGAHHCFLTGAPWTQCGRKTLTSYFLNQCMTFYYAMSSNVDGLCGDKKTPEPVLYGKQYYADPYAPSAPAQPYGPPASRYYPTAAPAHQQYPTAASAHIANSYSASTLMSSDSKPAPSPAPAPVPTPAPTGRGYQGAQAATYQKERCLQSAYVSITTALVLCMTENMIRIKYIEHYAKDAANNPIEGPILYLKKLHTFVESVLSCASDAAKSNYPNLWTTFKDSDGFERYSPNMPYTVDDNSMVSIDQHMSAAAIGFEDFTIDNYFLCNNVNELGSDGIYTTDATNPHYSLPSLSSCTTSKALTELTMPEVVKRCPLKVLPINTAAGPKGPQGQYYADMSIKSLYQAVHYTSRQTTAAFRVMSIAETAVMDAGVTGQPLLEGFGIMYFCAFYACKANNAGKLDGTCFPKFDCESDWTVPATVGSYRDFNKHGDKVTYCLSEKWLINDDVSGNVKVIAFKKLAQRSYICMAENRIVDFYKKIVGFADKDTAAAQVYGRFLAVEKCHVQAAGACATNAELYEKLYEALVDLAARCETRRAEYYKKKHSYAYTSRPQSYQHYPSAQQQRY